MLNWIEKNNYNVTHIQPLARECSGFDRQKLNIEHFILVTVEIYVHWHVISNLAVWKVEGIK